MLYLADGSTTVFQEHISLQCKGASTNVRPSQSHVPEAVVVQQRRESLDRRRVELLQQTTRVVPHGAHLRVLARVVAGMLLSPQIYDVTRHVTFL